MTSKNQGRVALVTGAGGGLGGYFVERLAQDGCDVVVTDIIDCGPAVARIEAAGRRALALDCDLTNPDAIEDLAQKAIAHFGRVDILVNNAADLANHSTPFEEMTGPILRRSFTINVEAPFLLSKALASSMRERSWGRIVNIGTGSAWSTIALSGPISGYMVGYVTSKMALVGLTRILAGTFAPDGITVNLIAPALTRSPLSDALPQPFWDATVNAQMIKRPGVPEDLSRVLSFLCSEDAGFVTGQTYHVDGGAVV